MRNHAFRFTPVVTLALASLASLAVPGCASVTTAEDRADSDPPPPFTDVVYGPQYGKHVHFQSFNDKTYISLSASAEDEPYVWSVDHDTGQWQGPVQVGNNELPLDDLHGNPSMVIDDDGYIHVWYGSHGHYRTSERIYARSKHPEDISEWIHPEFDPEITYPMVSVMSDGTICVLYRAGGHSMPGSDAWVIRKSNDNGLSWSEPRVILQQMSRKSTSDLYAVPAKYPDQDKIGIGISDEFLPGSPTRHTTSHLFYLVYDAADDTLENVEGKKLDAPEGADIETLRQHCLIADYDAMGNYNRRIEAQPRIDAEGRVQVWAQRGDPAGFEPRPDDFDRSRPLKIYKDGGKGHPSNYGELTYGSAKHRLWTWDGHAWQHRDDAVNPRMRTDIQQARERLKEALGRGVVTLTNTGHRLAHPDARAVFFERNDEGRGRAWLWGDAGFLAPPKPLSQAVVPVSVGFHSIAKDLRIEATGQRNDDGTFAIPVHNTLNQPLSLSVKALPDHGQGWTLKDVSPDPTLAPGEKQEVGITSNWVQGTIRYPLPRFSVSLQTADPDGGQMSRRGSLDLPVVGTRPGVTAAVTTAAPTINGAPDERIWRRDPDVPGFAQMRQRRDIEPRTEAWAAWDDEALYLAFRCDEPEVGKLKLDAADRDDNVFQDDSVEIMLDPDGDGDGEGRDYFQIIVSAANVVFDGKGFDNSITLAGLETATAVGKDAWTAEIAIPWESLGLDGPPDHAGILLARNRHVIGKHEVFQFPLSPKGNHQPAMFATLRLSE